MNPLVLQNGECRQHCDPGYTQNDQQVCISYTQSLGISEEKVEAANATISTSTATISASSFISNVLTSGNSGSFYQFILLLSVISLFKYLNVNYPANLNMMFEMLSSSEYSYPNLFSEVLQPGQNTTLEEAKHRVTYPKFSKYQSSSLFLENYGRTLSLIMTLLPLWLVSCFFVRALESRKEKNKVLRYAHKFFSAARALLEFNLLITFILAYLIRLTLAICLQLRYPSFSNSYTALSTVMAVILAVALVAIVVFLLQSAKPAHPNAWAFIVNRCQVLVSDLETSEEDKPTPVFMIMRNISFVMVVVLLNNHPIPQVVLAVAVWVTYLAKLLRRRLYKSKRQNTVMRIAETLLLVSLCFILILAIDDEIDSLGSYGRLLFGWVIAVVLLVVLVTLLMFQITETLRLIWVLLKKISAKARSRDFRKKKIDGSDTPPSVSSSMPFQDLLGFADSNYISSNNQRASSPSNRKSLNLSESVLDSPLELKPGRLLSKEHVDVQQEPTIGSPLHRPSALNINKLQTESALETSSAQASIFIRNDNLKTQKEASDFPNNPQENRRVSPYEQNLAILSLMTREDGQSLSPNKIMTRPERLNDIKGSQAIESNPFPSNSLNSNPNCDLTPKILGRARVIRPNEKRSNNMRAVMPFHLDLK